MDECGSLVSYCIKLGCSQVVSLSSFRNVNLIINVLLFAYYYYYMHIDVLTITLSLVFLKGD